jgi:hypothetical protein
MLSFMSVLIWILHLGTCYLHLYLYVDTLQILIVVNVQIVVCRSEALYSFVGGYHCIRGVCVHHPLVKMKVEAAFCTEMSISIFKST